MTINYCKKISTYRVKPDVRPGNPTDRDGVLQRSSCQANPSQGVVRQIPGFLNGQREAREREEGRQVGCVERREDGDEHPPRGEQHPAHVCQRTS